MEFSIDNDLIIECAECGEILIIDKDSLDVETSSWERPMGAEVEYAFRGECECKCGNQISYAVFAYEYPEGALNYESHECDGGRITNDPSIKIDYYEFDYDAYEEDSIRADVERTRMSLNRRLERQEISRLTSRDFEELVADVFSFLGYNVRLTKQTRDGGYDMIATKNIDGLSYMIIIECKKYASHRKVDVALVRGLYGVQASEQANKSVLVTSSAFTADARAFAEERRNLISLCDINDLIEMINKA